MDVDRDDEILEGADIHCFYKEKYANSTASTS